MINQITRVLCITVVLLLASVLFLSKPVYAEAKIAYADLAYIFDNYEKTKAQDQVLEKETKQKREERQRLVNEIRKLRDEIEMLSDRAKEKKQGEIDEKIAQLQEYDQQARVGLAQQRDKMVNEILAEIEIVVAKYAKDNGYSLILNDDKRVVLYSEESDNITRNILSTLNSKYKK